MAAIGDKIEDELNLIFKFLSEKKTHPLSTRINNHQHFVASFMLWLLSSYSKKTTKNQIMARLYGSTAEDLNCPQCSDVGDMDIMIFPNSDNLLIHEKSLEYSLENPMHVRIKGSDHPVLQSCLVEDTEYVATSALKNFHPEMFGWGVPAIFKHFTLVSDVFSREEFPTVAATSLKNDTTSPALTMNIALITMLQRNYPFKIMELLVNMCCSANGINYTRQHVQLLDSICPLLEEIGIAEDPISVLGRMFICFFRFFGTKDNCSELQLQIIAQLRDIVGLPQNTAVHGVPDVTVMPQSCDTIESSEYLGKSTIIHSTMPTEESVERFFHLLTKLVMAVFPTNTNTVSEDKEKNGSCSNTSETEQLLCLLGQERVLNLEDQPSNSNSRKEEGMNDLVYVANRFIKHALGVGAEEKEAQTPRAQTQETKCNDKGRSKGGYDVIPALRSREWPKVAQEWIERERKWPSPDVVEKVIQEGFHLVVKAPKNNANPDCDFRISFSHAEYLLSHEMNDIQRDCYRCLKRLHRGYLSTQPKSLASFHLKNIFLQTIEETGAEMWNDSSKSECMTRLLGNLLEALKRKDLRHFFVKSYNLFGEDYIENPEILYSLAGKVEQIMENPSRFLEELKQKEEDVKKATLEKHLIFVNSEPTLPVKLVKIEDTFFVGYHGTHGNKAVPLLHMLSKDGSAAATDRYHDLKDIYQEVTKELINMAFNNAHHCRLETMDPLLMSLVEDLKELERKHDVTVEEFREVLARYWDGFGYYKAWSCTETDLRRRMLLVIQGAVEIMKYASTQDDYPNCGDIQVKILQDPSFDLNHILPFGFCKQIIHSFLDNSLTIQAQSHVGNGDLDDIPLD